MTLHNLVRRHNKTGVHYESSPYVDRLALLLPHVADRKAGNWTYLVNSYELEDGVLMCISSYLLIHPYTNKVMLREDNT